MRFDRKQIDCQRIENQLVSIELKGPKLCFYQNILYLYIILFGVIWNQLDGKK